MMKHSYYFIFLIFVIMLASCNAETAEGMDISTSESYAEKITAADTENANITPINVRFSLEGCYCEDGTLVELSVAETLPDGAAIYYTTDGDEPTLKSAVYAAPIAVSDDDNCFIIRASVLDKNGEYIGNIVTNTYFTTDTYPSVKSISLVTDDNNLNSSKYGIFENADKTGRESERPVSVEIFDTMQNRIVSQDAAIRLSGSGSKSFTPPSMRITARKSEYLDENGIKYNGDGKFTTKIFKNSDTSYFDSFILRNGGNDSLYASTSSFRRMNMLRDGVTNNLVCNLQQKYGFCVFSQNEEPVAVYLNGEFYGFFNLKEDFDDNSLSNQYGLDKNNITVIKGKKLYYKTESGDESELDEWKKLCQYAIDNALADDYNQYLIAYDYLCSQIDMENLTWYYGIMTYFCNTDWPQNNAMVWRYTGEYNENISYSDGKWRFVIRDMDLCFALHDASSQTSSTTYTMADTDTLRRLLIFYYEGNGYMYDESTKLYEDEMKLQGLFDFCMRNAEFRSKFINVCNILMSDEVKQMSYNAIDSYKNLADVIISDHITLWKKKDCISSSYSYDSWKKAIDYMYEFADERAAYFREYLSKWTEYYTNK